MPQKTNLQVFGLFLALAALVAVVPFLWNRGGDDPAQMRTAGLEIGQVMPEVGGAGWVNGSAPSPADLQGKVVVVNAWRTDCPFCHKGMPPLVDMYRRYKDQDVVFIGLTSNDAAELEEVKGYLNHYGADWPNAYGAIDTLIRFKAEYIPGYWIIGRDGRVVWNRGSKEPIETALQQALASTATAARDANARQ